MWPFLDKPTEHPGVVLYRGPIAPPMEQVLGLASGDVAVAAGDPPQVPHHWAVRLTHPAWGEAVVVAPRGLALPDEDFIRQSTPKLTTSERELIGRAETLLVVFATTPERDMLRARKHLLRWLHLLMALDGVVAMDKTSELFWSKAMLEDELAHDAALDVEALYTIHAVYEDVGDTRVVFWLHSHGLEALGAFDIDVLRPSAWLADQAGDPFRALAFAALEGVVSPTTTHFRLGNPGGVVDFVPVKTFDASAAASDVQLRDPGPPHDGRRAVVCEPRGLFGFLRRKPIPSRFLETIEGEGVVFNFTKAASELMSARARATLDVFKALIAEFGPDLPNGLKIGYPTASDPTGKEHLWFEVHGFDGERVDATLMNQPFDVPSLQQGQRGWHPVDDVSDWTVMSPAGPMTPRNLSAARRLRESGWPDGPFGDLVRAAKNPEA
jgi:uncharacterized protein YegJ (DUF2314 family)